MNNLVNNSLVWLQEATDRDTRTNSEKTNSCWTIICDISYIERVIEGYSACRDKNISYQWQKSMSERMNLNLTMICDLK